MFSKKYPERHSILIRLFISGFIAACLTFNAPAILLAIQTDGCIDLDYKNCGIVRASYNLIADFSSSLELLNEIKDGSTGDNYKSGDKYKALYIKIKKDADALSKKIIDDMAQNNLDSLKSFSILYKSKGLYERQALYFVCAQLIDAGRFMSNNKTSLAEISNAENFLRENFPGYGESDPYYYYRKGRELSSEVVDTYWKEVKNTYTSAQIVTGEISIDYLKELENNPDVNIIEYGEPFAKIIDGAVIWCTNVKFEAMATITTISKRKYDLTKVWFELLRNKYSIFVNKWEVCGKTYEMHEFYTGSEVILKWIK